MVPTLVSMCALLLGLVGGALAQEAPRAAKAVPAMATTPIVEQPTLALVGMDAYKKLSWHTQRSPVDHTVTIEETGNAVGAQITLPDIHLTADDLETVLKPEPASFTLGAGESRAIRLTGTLPAAGTWTGTFTIERPGGHHLFDLSVERGVPAALPTLEALAPSRIVRGLGETLLPVQVQIAEAGVRPVDVSSLTLTRLLPPDALPTSSASIPTRACWSQGAGGAPTSPCADDGVPGAAVAIAPGGAAQWALALSVPWEAGVYTGDVQARTQEGDNIPRAQFTFSVKHPWYLCLGTVALGVALSTALRAWLGAGRAAAVAAIPLARLSDAIRTLPDGDRIRLLLELEVSRLAGDPEAQAAGITNARQILDNHLAIGRVQALVPMLPKLVPDPVRRGELQARITTLLGKAVDLPSLTNGADGKNPLVTEAGAIYEAVRLATDQAVQTETQALRDGAAEARRRLGRLNDPARVAALTARLTTLEAPLTERPAPDDAAAQLARLNAARTALAAVAADLDAALPDDNAAMGETAPGTFATLLDGLGVPVTLPKLTFGAPPVTSEKGLMRWIRSMDFAVAIVVVVLACVFALYELWWQNDGWGTLGDYLAALVWGFGAHVLGGAAQAGVATQSAA